MNFQTCLKILGEIVNLIVLVLFCFFIWYILTITYPDYRFIVVLFAIIFLIFKFPKELFKLIIANAILLQLFISNIVFKESPKGNEGREEEDNEGVIENDEMEEDNSEDGLFAWQDFVYKGCIAISIVFMFVISWKLMDDNAKAKQISEYNLKNSDINISMDPIQYSGGDLKSFKKTVKGKTYNIKELASYKIAGIVVAKNTFLIFDSMNELSPVDIGLVWGDLAKPENYKKMGFASNFRLLTYSTPGGFTLSNEFITLHSSHNHLIPSDEKIRSVLMNLSYDDKVIMEGYLVEVTINGLNPWTSSLRRDDHLFNSGRGCEIFYVEKVSKVKQ